MQFKIEENKPKPFEPITITITLESAGELADLADRLNLNLEGQTSYYKVARVDNLWKLWDHLDGILKHMGLRK
jgi:hypothetical protein